LNHCCENFGLPDFCNNIGATLPNGLGRETGEDRTFVQRGKSADIVAKVRRPIFGARLIPARRLRSSNDSRISHFRFKHCAQTKWSGLLQQYPPLPVIGDGAPKAVKPIKWE
jgi:hypothetical protein